ncbi:MAG: type IV pilin [Thermoplasmata archaeon]|nr:type IV pilin [Candidatus Sysuiplasma acidicola]MBX8646306.1 type IV pilin [Candidatus Sysuiplasma acidicola]MDH2904800.1 type IV pilin N-terminal domain-containing protein [Methanomassiliicoccales archaeon]
MISNRHKASFRKHKDSGVSEIIGDILILAMTVTLFSTVFVFVNAFPTPNAQTFANFNATLSSPSTNFFGTNSALLNITHEGGQQLTSSLTSVIVQINQTTSVYALSSGYVFVNSTLAIPWSSSKWTTSQTWIMNLTGVTPSSVVGVSIIDKANNYIVWSTVLKGKSGNVQPVVQSVFANPNPVTPGNNITVFASIYGHKNINVSANVSLVSSVQTIYLTYNSSAGLYQSGKVQTEVFLAVGASYPITVEVKGPGSFSTNQTFNLYVENTGPRIVVSSINPNPGTPGTNFNITAYVVDNNQTSFNPPNAGAITVTPLAPIITNITAQVSMKPSSYPGIFTLTGHINGTTLGSFEPFIVTATDINGNKAIYTVELVVVDSLNPNQNQSFPSKYLGPTSMSFSNFKWDPANSVNTYYPGNSVSTSITNTYGIYFNVVLQNHNTSQDLYLDDLSNIYLFFGAQKGFAQALSFIVINSTSGSQLWNVSTSGGYQPLSKVPTGYPSLGWSSSSNSPSGSPWNTAYVLLPAAIGGVAVDSHVVFGSAVASTGNAYSVPSTSGGPFGPFSGSSKSSPGTISADFLELFGYTLPAGTYPWLKSPQTYGVPYGQTLPFTAIFWY